MTGLLCGFKENQNIIQSFHICAGSTMEFVIISIMLQRKNSDTLCRFPPTQELVKESNETILDVFKEKKPKPTNQKANLKQHS